MDYCLLDRAPTPACAHTYETARFRVMALRDAGLKVPRCKSGERFILGEQPRKFHDYNF